MTTQQFINLKRLQNSSPKAYLRRVEKLSQAQVQPVEIVGANQLQRRFKHLAGLGSKQLAKRVEFQQKHGRVLPAAI
jgi:hypothetical protein